MKKELHLASRRKFVSGAGFASAGIFMGASGAGSLCCAGNPSPGETGSISYRKDLPLADAYDVVVCGGGPSGCAAALAARREGLKTLLVEGMGQLGGMAVTGLVTHWLGGRTQEGEWVVGGIFKSLAEEAAQKGYALIPSLNPKEKYHPFGWFNWFIHGIPLDPCKVDLFLDEKMEEAGVDVLLQTQFVDVIADGNRLSHLVIFNRSDMMAVPVKAVIDATGNADVAFRSKCDTVRGRKRDGGTAPPSLIFHVYNVDQEALMKGVLEIGDPKLRPLIRSLREKGIWDSPTDIFVCTQTPNNGEFFINNNAIFGGVDGTDGKSVAEALVTGRKQIRKLMEIYRSYFPGFKDARLKAVAPQLGVRESRRICGDFMLKVEDLSKDRFFDDCIGFSMYGWDLGDPVTGKQVFADDRASGLTYTVKKGLSTPLPYRMMIPKPVANLICPGRAVSVEGQVLGPVRVMAPCMAMGEAAGVAVSQVVKRNVSFDSVDIAALRERLRNTGAILDKEALPPIYPRVDQV